MYFCHFISLVAFTIVTITLAPPSGPKIRDYSYKLGYNIALAFLTLDILTSTALQQKILKNSHKVTIKGKPRS